MKLQNNALALSTSQNYKPFCNSFHIFTQTIKSKNDLKKRKTIQQHNKILLSLLIAHTEHTYFQY